MTTRRRVLGAIGTMAATAAAAALPPARAVPAQSAVPPVLRRVPSSGETLPCIGLGSWITFNVGNDPPALAACAAVMRAFFDGGGRVIDSSPMYGSAQATIGH
ncbi:MAG: aldo/keto reductase, partial [Rubrivivax sp.]|nr:aldo/keto reductase [Rubrivivax sp.]